MLLLNVIVVFVIVLLVFMIIPVFLIYPGLYYGRWKSSGPVFSFRSLDGTELDGVIYEPVGGGLVKRDTIILYFHGNNLNIGSRTSFFTQVVKILGVPIVSIDYRGFGNSKGFPSEKGICLDAQAIYDRVLNDDRFRNHRKVVMGKSLGGAVAVALTANQKRSTMPQALILENTFMNVKEVANDSYKVINIVPDWLKDFILVDNPWRSDIRLSGLEGVPQLFLVGSRDGVVNKRHMNTLYGISRGPKERKEYSGGGHTNLHKQNGYFEDIASFLNNS